MVSPDIKGAWCFL